VKEIKLTRGMAAFVDDGDFEWLSQFTWYAQTGYKKCYYACTHIGRKIISMHRLVMQASPEQQVDHENHNGLDNRRSNLRLCTQSLNNANKRSFIGRSQFKGVTLWKKTKRWRGKIHKDGHQIHLGYFATEEEAAHAYDKAAVELYGEFSLTNKKEGLF
jgi:hypothetical protein